jgi:cyclopropane fatty-acyl-phospholipid synthase-like methyltransferase
VSLAKIVMRKFYRDAQGSPERLPWHRESPSRLLAAAVEASERGVRALDVGCGAGVFTVWLAERGAEVTGIDIFPEAIAMARSLADKRGVKVEFLTANLFDFTPERPFDLVYDSGCLHSLVDGNINVYKQTLLGWLSSGGAYVLEHWGKRHALDWRPVGPRRRPQTQIKRIFAPEFELLEADVTDFSAPLPFGPTVRGVGYWFHRLPPVGHAV